MDSWVPTGMVSRRPIGRSAEATQTRQSPWRRKIWALSPVASRSCMSTGPGGGDEAVLAGGGGQLHQPAAEDEAALDVAADQAVVDQGQGEPVHCGPGQSRGSHQLRQGGGAGLKRVEHMGRFIDDTDSTRIVHVLILPSHYLRCKSIALAYCWARAGSVEHNSPSNAQHLAVKGAWPWPKTLAEKVWDAHVVRKGDGEGANAQPDLLFIDLHLVHEVTSPQAFEGLRLAGRKLRRPDLTIATEDHNTPTLDIDKPIADLTSRTQIQTLRNNCEEFGVRLHSLGDAEQGIVHVVGPQLGLTQPGMTVVCGDSHTSTHGAFGALAMGIGTSEVEHVMATQTLSLKPFKTMAINVEGTLRPGVTRQGHHPGRHRQDRHRRRPGLRPGIPRLRHPRAVHGSPDDHLQHVHRGRRPRRPGGSGPDHLRLHVRPPARAAGRGLGCRRRILEHAAHRRRRRVRRRGGPRRRHPGAVRHLGHQPGPGRLAVREGAVAGGLRRRKRQGRRRTRPAVHGPARPARR